MKKQHKNKKQNHQPYQITLVSSQRNDVLKQKYERKVILEEISAREHDLLYHDDGHGSLCEKQRKIIGAKKGRLDKFLCHKHKKMTGLERYKLKRKVRPSDLVVPLTEHIH